MVGRLVTVPGTQSQLDKWGAEACKLGLQLLMRMMMRMTMMMMIMMVMMMMIMIMIMMKMTMMIQIFMIVMVTMYGDDDYHNHDCNADDENGLPS